MNLINNNANRVAIIGASGYGGIQLLRLLNDHPFFKVTFLGGERTSDRRWNEVSPFLQLEDDPIIKKPDPDEIAENSDYVLLSLPNGISSQLSPELLKRNVRVVDLSADYRYRSLTEWKRYYSVESNAPQRTDDELCKESIYGLPEWNPHEIKNSSLVACPGCFPTASLFPLLPFINQGLIENDGIIIDAKTGTSGGGRNGKEHLLLAEASEAIAPYGVIGHRHTSEIEQQLTDVSGKEIQIQFTPHLVPMVRGLLATIYCRLRDPGLTAEDAQTVIQSVYRNYKTIEILPVGIYPSTKWVRYTNKLLISVQVDKRNSRLIILSAIDNLIKGQAGQAIQNLNIMAGLKDETGLPLKSYYP